MATITPQNRDLTAGMAGQSSDTLNPSADPLLTGDVPAWGASDIYPLASDVVFVAREVVGFDGSGYLVPATYAAVAGAKATGQLTFSDVGNEGDEIVIGDVTYTLTATVASAYDVLIGASVTETATNLRDAINRLESAEGTTFGTDTEDHPSVTASSAAGVVTVTARQGGDEANAVVTTETSTEAAWASATLTGGAGEETGVKAIGIVAYAADNDGGSDGDVNAEVWRSGVFNPDLLTWDDSFDTDEKKRRAFEGSPAPTTIYIRKPTTMTVA